MKLKTLVGSADRIMLLILPFFIIGTILNVLFPKFFSVGGPSDALKIVSIILLILGVVVYIWSVILILVKVPTNELITTGPYTLLKHPLYNGVSLLVLPWLGFLLNTWLGILVGLVLYLGRRLYAPEEEKKLSSAFGTAWDEYSRKVLLPWL